MIYGLDLFSGYGGISYALREWVWPVAYCEIEPYCQAILLSRMQNHDLVTAPIWDDVRLLHSKHLPKREIDIIYGGFPCQDISVAGTGKGLEGKRSKLFFEIARIVKEIKPTFIFLENVPAIRTRGAEQVCKKLASLGYDCRWTTLSAGEIGAPHERTRWFLLAYSHSNSVRTQQIKWDECKEAIIAKYASEAGVATNSGSQSKVLRQAEERIKNVQSQWDGITRNVASNAESKRLQGWSSPKRIQAKQFGISCPDRWSAEPPVCGVDDGTPFRLDRIKSLGNGVVPAQVKAAFKELMGL